MTDSDNPARARQTTTRAKREISIGEWIVAFLSALVAISSIGHAFYLAATTSGAPPKVRVTIDRIVETENSYVVEFWA